MSSVCAYSHRLQAAQPQPIRIEFAGGQGKLFNAQLSMVSGADLAITDNSCADIHRSVANGQVASLELLRGFSDVYL